MQDSRSRSREHLGQFKNFLQMLNTFVQDFSSSSSGRDGKVAWIAERSMGTCATSPVTVMTLQVAGWQGIYKGEGANQKMAKHAAAEAFFADPQVEEQWKAMMSKRFLRRNSSAKKD